LRRFWSSAWHRWAPGLRKDENAGRICLQTSWRLYVADRRLQKVHRAGNKGQVNKIAAVAVARELAGLWAINRQHKDSVLTGFLYAAFFWDCARPQGQAPSGWLRQLDPVQSRIWSHYEKTSSSNRESGGNQESSRSAYEKENPRPGYEVCASKTLVSRLKAAPDGSIVMRKPAYIRMINRRCSRPSAPGSVHYPRAQTWRSQPMVP
jgi:hypothetical protein